MELDPPVQAAEISEIPVFLSPIANPLSTRKVAKKCLKLVKKASKTKSIRRGVKEVVKAIRKGEKGVVILAGNVTPIDVITHIPILCEESNIPYIFVPSKEDLGAAGNTKRATSVILVKPPKPAQDHEEYYKDSLEEIQKVQLKL